MALQPRVDPVNLIASPLGAQPELLFRKTMSGALARCEQATLGQQYSSGNLHAGPCGYHGIGGRECRCTGAIIQRYLGKISGPLLDRIDLHIEVPSVAYKELRGKGDGVDSNRMRERVAAARVTAKHVAEAVQYRGLDRSYWN